MSGLDMEDLNLDLLVIDADYLVYRVASVLEQRSVVVKDSSGQTVGFHKHKSAFKETLDEDDDISNYSFETVQKLEAGWEDTLPILVDSITQRLMKATKTDDVVFAIGSPINYRSDIKTPTKYKSNRSEVIKPLLVKEVSNYIIENYSTESPEAGEADDVCAYYQHKSLTSKNRIVVCTPDKDARSVSCKELYNPNTEKTISIEGFGFIEDATKGSTFKVYAQGRLMLYYQMLRGDTIDAYAPCDVFKQINKIGKKAPMISERQAFNLLYPCKTDLEAWTMLQKQYQEWYPDTVTWTSWSGEECSGDYIDIMQMCMDACYMKRWETDRPQVRKILENFELV